MTRSDGSDLPRGKRRVVLRRHATVLAAGAGSARARGTDRHRARPDTPGPDARGPPPGRAGRPAMKLFGTDGLRGKAGEFPLDPASVRILAASSAGGLCERARAAGSCVGGDTRESTPRIVADLAAGLREGGCGVAPAGSSRRPASPSSSSSSERWRASPSPPRTTPTRTTASRSSGPTAASGRTTRRSRSSGDAHGRRRSEGSDRPRTCAGEEPSATGDPDPASRALYLRAARPRAFPSEPRGSSVLL